MGTITALLLGIFLFTGCSPAFVEQQRVIYEEELFKEAETIQEKAEILNEEFIKVLFSADKKNQEDILLKLSLYSTPGFLKSFEENTYPLLTNIELREYIEMEMLSSEKGKYILEDTEIQAYEIISLVHYRQDEHLLNKEVRMIYAYLNNSLKIIELQETDMEIMKTEKP